MNRKTLRALLALNVVLLVALVLVGLTPTPAQGQGQFGRSQYSMVAGLTAGRKQQAVIYIFDLANARIAAVMYNSANDTYEKIDTVKMRRRD
jgi:hypothetical protein